MIDIEYAQFNIVKNDTSVKALCADCGTEELKTAPAAFPYFSFVQKDNPSYKPSQDSDSKENHVQPMIQVDVYQSVAKGGKYSAKQIASKIDDCMASYGWERIFGYQPIADSTSYTRLTARYQAIIRQNAPNDFTVI